jgi:hypothetical protein
MRSQYIKPIVPYVPESPSFVLPTMFFFEKEAQKFGNIAGGVNLIIARTEKHIIKRKLDLLQN